MMREERDDLGAGSGPRLQTNFQIPTIFLFG